VSKVTEDYNEIVKEARRLADEDVEVTNDSKGSDEWDKRYTMHLTNMLEVQQLSEDFCPPDRGEAIVDFLEKQLFRTPPVENETCHLTYDMWRDIRKVILEKPEEVMSG